MAAIVSVCLPVSTKLFSCGVRFYSLVARRFRLKHRSRIQGHDLSSLEVLAEVRSSLCFASNEILSVSLCLCRCICININIARPRIGHEPPNVHIGDLGVLLEPAGSIGRYQEDREIYKSGYMLLFQSFHSG